jgi:hypothetical protein
MAKIMPDKKKRKLRILTFLRRMVFMMSRIFETKLFLDTSV